MKLFKRKQDDAIKKEKENPYLKARRIHDNVTVGLIEANRLGKMMMLACLLVTMASVGGVLFLGSQSQLVPYVVEVDKLGQMAAVGRADKAAVADERIVKATLAQFIADSRRVSFDGNLQNEAIWRVFSKLKQKDPSLVKMKAYMMDPDTSPMKRAVNETVDVAVITIFHQAERSWEITWTETAWNRNGAQIRKHLMRGIFNIYFVPPSSSDSEQDIFRNPLGLFVRDFSWARVVE